MTWGTRYYDGPGFARCQWVSQHREDLDKIGIKIADGLGRKIDWVPDDDGLRAKIAQGVFIRIGCHAVPKAKRLVPALVIEDFNYWSGHGRGNRVVGKFRLEGDGDLDRGVKWIGRRTRGILSERKKLDNHQARRRANLIGSFAKARSLVGHELRTVPADSYKIPDNAEGRVLGLDDRDAGIMTCVYPLFDGAEYHHDKIVISLQAGVGRKVKLGKDYKEGTYFRPAVARRILKLLNRVKKIADEEASKLEAKHMVA